MTTSQLAPRANSGEALPRRSFARLDSFDFFAAPARKRLGLQLRKLTLIAIGVLLAGQSLSASVATLAWDANPEPDIAGYKISYGEAPGKYTTTVDVGNSTVTDISGLTQDKTYYFSVAAYNTTGAMSLPSSEISYTIGANSYSTEVAPNNISVHFVDSEDPDGYPASYAVDGDPNTFWHTAWRTSSPPPPHELQVDLGSVLNLKGFRYLPRQDTSLSGNIGQYECYISANGTDWGIPVATGSFSNTKEMKIVTFTAKTGRFVRLRALTDANGRNYSNIAELTLLQSIEIPTKGINTAPVANAQSQNTAEDTPLNISLTGTDSESSVLSYAVATAPLNGTLSGTAPNLTYTPKSNYSGTDSFTFRVNDGSLDSSAATISITITPVNDAPVGVAKSVTTPEDTPIAVSLDATDADVNPLTFTVVANPTKGTLSGTAPNLTYTPSANFNGSDSFTFRANDGLVNSTAATISITITPVNDAPVAVVKSFTTPEDTPIAVSLSATDADANPLTFAVVANPTKGTLSGTPPNLTYTPSADFNGSDSFTFRANDGLVNSTAATISITITPVNDAPVALAKAISTPKNTPVAVLLAGTDKDANVLSYSVVSGPTNGTLSGSAQNLTYTPKSNYSGSDSFTFQVNDGTVNSAAATISITITPTNEAPVAIAKSVTTPEDTSIAVSLSATDADANPLTFAVVANPTKGTLSGTPPNLTYTPSADFNGSDSFTFRANDGLVNSTAATISITITPVNDAPVALAKAVTTPEDTSIAVFLNATDADADPLTFTVVTNPTKGTLSGTPPNLTYTPSADFNGSDSFTFRANDGLVNSTAATISITITPVNDAPVALAKATSTPKNIPVAVALAAFDKDANTLSYSVVSGPKNGTLSGAAKSPTYTPNSNYSGSDSFTFQVNDGTVDSASATISIAVIPTTETLSPFARSVTTPEDTAVPVPLNGADAGDTLLTYAVATQPAHGSLSGTSPNLTYTPSADFNGSDSFTFLVNNGTTDFISATVSISVTPVNDAPTATSLILTTAEDTALPLVLSGSDRDSNNLSFIMETAPTKGTLTGTAPNFTYSPAANFNGSDQFTFRVNDGTVSSQAATVFITVTSVNDAPTALAESLTTTENISLPVVLGGSDIDGSPLTFTVVKAPAKGSLSGTAPNLTYLPNAGFIGSDSFTFKANDGKLDSATATVSITVTAAKKTKPGKRKIFTSNSLTLRTTEAQAFSTQQLTTEPDTGTALTFTKTSGPDWLSISADGVISGTPDSSDVGDNSFTVTVIDSLGSSDEVELTISVANENHAPAFINNPITLEDASENASYTNYTLAGQAVDADANDSLRYWKVTGPDWLNVAPSGELSGTPPPGSAGMNNFTVGVADSSSAVAFSELRINVVGLPLPWATANLGTGQLEGVTSYRAGIFTQAGAGAVGSTSDKFRFTYQTLSGDGEIIAKVDIRQTVGSASFAGVMIRESLDPKAPHVFIGISDDKSYRQASRTKNGKKTSVKSSAPTGTADSWVRIVRDAKKKQIYTYKSADGVNWIFLETIKIKMAANCHVGLLVSSGSDSTLTTSTFSNVYVAP